LNAGGNALGDFFGDAVGGSGDAAADGLPKTTKSGFELPFASAAAGADADGVRFVGD